MPAYKYESRYRGGIYVIILVLNIQMFHLNQLLQWLTRKVVNYIHIHKHLVPVLRNLFNPMSP